MHFIYARSFITLCASDSEDGTGGLFKTGYDTTLYRYSQDKIGCVEKWSEALAGPLSIAAGPPGTPDISSGDPLHYSSDTVRMSHVYCG
jgi:hypothetical protein